MKRDEIIAKWAGMTARERDAWVAEVVFGWAPLRDGRMRSRDGFMIRSLPEYTTDIAASWAVFDRFFSGTLVILGNGYGHECKIAGQYGETRAVVRGEYTAPEAICLAAILAKLTEVSA